jgi:hypothetical protein
MITMNDKVSIEMTLTQATLLRSLLFTTAYELKKSEPRTSQMLSEFEALIQKQLNKLDFSENEKLVDRINAKTEKEAKE